MQFLLFELADDKYLKIGLKEFRMQQNCEIISGGDQKSNNRATDYYSIFVCDAQFITYLNRNSNRFHDIETPSGPRLDINLSNSDTLRSQTMVLRGYVGVPGYKNDHSSVNHNN